MRDGIDPCKADEALRRMRHLETLAHAEYQLGTGTYHPTGYALKYDCAGAAICEAYKLYRTRKGFASGSPRWPEVNDVDDDINTNSAIEDAFGKQEIFEPVLEGPLVPGDLVMWATITINVAVGKHVFIGHVLMLAAPVPDGWTPAQGFHRCRFLQCCGPNGRTPAIIETDGSVIDRHNATWPKDGMRAYAIRVKGSQE